MHTSEPSLSAGIIDAHIEDLIATDTYVRVTIKDNANKEIRIVEYQYNNDSRADVTITHQAFDGTRKGQTHWTYSYSRTGRHKKALRPQLQWQRQLSYVDQ